MIITILITSCMHIGYDSYHHFSTPSLPLTIEIIISENDEYDG